MSINLRILLPVCLLVLSLPALSARAQNFDPAVRPTFPLGGRSPYTPEQKQDLLDKWDACDSKYNMQQMEAGGGIFLGGATEWSKDDERDYRDFMAECLNYKIVVPLSLDDLPGPVGIEQYLGD